jgi:hypothetical protein
MLDPFYSVEENERCLGSTSCFIPRLHFNFCIKWKHTNSSEKDGCGGGGGDSGGDGGGSVSQRRWLVGIIECGMC